VRVVSDETGVSAPEPAGPLTPVERGIMTALVTDAPELLDAGVVGTTMDPEPVAMADEMIELETALASATGQTVCEELSVQFQA
jgi:hypothetical protein